MTGNDRLLCITMKTYSLSYSAGFLFHYFVLMLGSALHCILVAVTTLPIWNLDSGLWAFITVEELFTFHISPRPTSSRLSKQTERVSGALKINDRTFIKQQKV